MEAFVWHTYSYTFHKVSFTLVLFKCFCIWLTFFCLDQLVFNLSSSFSSCIWIICLSHQVSGAFYNNILEYYKFYRNTGPEGWRLRQRHFETVTSLVRSCRKFFPPGSAFEIWSEFRCSFCFLLVGHELTNFKLDIQ